MKKVLFGLMAIALISATTSCKKCGYCRFANGTTTETVCKSGNPILGGLLDEYDTAKGDCDAAQGTWVVTK